jgi:restriction system protein
MERDPGVFASVDAAEPLLDFERVARDRLAQIVAERFAGHPLARLVAAILEAEGYTCEVSPAGPDSGVDILAARGPLGLDSPHVVVQVKSGASPVDAPTSNSCTAHSRHTAATRGYSWHGED